MLRAGSSQVRRLDLGCDDPAGNQRENVAFGMKGLSPPFSITHQASFPNSVIEFSPGDKKGCKKQFSPL